MVQTLMRVFLLSHPLLLSSLPLHLVVVCVFSSFFGIFEFFRDWKDLQKNRYLSDPSVATSDSEPYKLLRAASEEIKQLRKKLREEQKNKEHMKTVESSMRILEMSNLTLRAQVFISFNFSL